MINEDSSDNKHLLLVDLRDILHLFKIKDPFNSNSTMYEVDVSDEFRATLQALSKIQNFTIALLIPEAKIDKKTQVITLYPAQATHINRVIFLFHKMYSSIGIACDMEISNSLNLITTQNKLDLADEISTHENIIVLSNCMEVLNNAVALKLPAVRCYGYGEFDYHQVNSAIKYITSHINDIKKLVLWVDIDHTLLQTHISMLCGKTILNTFMLTLLKQFLTQFKDLEIRINLITSRHTPTRFKKSDIKKDSALISTSNIKELLAEALKKEQLIATVNDPVFTNGRKKTGVIQSYLHPTPSTIRGRQQVHILFDDQNNEHAALNSHIKACVFPHYPTFNVQIHYAGTLSSTAMEALKHCGATRLPSHTNNEYLIKECKKIYEEIAHDHKLCAYFVFLANSGLLPTSMPKTLADYQTPLKETTSVTLIDHHHPLLTEQRILAFINYCKDKFKPTVNKLSIINQSGIEATQTDIKDSTLTHSQP